MKGDAMRMDGRAIRAGLRDNLFGKEYLGAAYAGNQRDEWASSPEVRTPSYSRFQRHDLVKVYKGASLMKARVLHASATDYFVHYQGYASDHDEWVPHYRVLEDKDGSVLDEPSRLRRRPEVDVHVQQLQIENKRLKDELAKTQALLATAHDKLAGEWMQECSQLQQKCLVVSDHCKKAVERVHGVLEEKQKVIDSWNCVVCLENQVNCALTPCGHTFCLGCAVQLDKCPICRQTSVAPLPIFRP
ncbi:hypothetical protein SPRG_13943 [Saprolegnia parasitica CBS 223.65]|uniref:RING-type domain-containing protein n=1 Tax=Saprolegnia parasitica (strain CBS 223.65) TaxID=695850 RepID=A0A067BVZ0_SAPPC|nr:hypothetical protein SPRG_13943 [Saprolegnia parasitica CBS 223.65]KDO21015.1 hypothetical protein SPRG_13943 [Saprolegnia parasitica CBS 223.65]|eukprot:XP_012208267.1 hypothetical protein SPRG_13943 [Saprolegnia parasitica CBS 223.65]